MVIYYLLQPLEEHHMELHFHSQRGLLCCLNCLMHSWKESNYHKPYSLLSKFINKLISYQFCQLSKH
ncbi:hypothetical protein NC651_034953 [Populus alba x Populus x berolinensis]|nr:hypothetical protein NC651_034953 [Populus alba x Populus x berolinensis]